MADYGDSDESDEEQKERETSEEVGEDEPGVSLQDAPPGGSGEHQLEGDVVV